MAVPERRYTSIVRGEYRNDPSRMQIVSEAQEIARKEVDFVLAKTRFYETYGDQLNASQKGISSS